MLVWELLANLLTLPIASCLSLSRKKKVSRQGFEAAHVLHVGCLPAIKALPYGKKVKRDRVVKNQEPAAGIENGAASSFTVRTHKICHNVK